MYLYGGGLLNQSVREDKFDGAFVEIYRSDKLLDSRDKVAFAFEFNLEEWVELVVVEIDYLAFGTTDAHLEAD